MALPAPDSEVVQQLPVSHQAREIYRLLYERQGEPLTMYEIRNLLPALGAQEQLDRRRRELNRYFVIEKTRIGAETRYRLASQKVRDTEGDSGITERDRAAVLRHGRCAMCGRTPLGDAIVLQVDHKIPKEWGGSDDLENLQPLCEECNRGKKNLFASYNDHAPEIGAAIGHSSVHKRIGELLKAFAPDPVRSDIIDLVASPPGDYQEDWQKRLRELRVLGWEIRVMRRREHARVRAYYQLVRSEPWPAGEVRDEIRRRERLRGY
jgi:5-methylcytosine-specific restriction endonuclease McrA